MSNKISNLYSKAKNYIKNYGYRGLEGFNNLNSIGTENSQVELNITGDENNILQIRLQDIENVNYSDIADQITSCLTGGPYKQETPYKINIDEGVRDSWISNYKKSWKKRLFSGRGFLRKKEVKKIFLDEFLKKNITIELYEGDEQVDIPEYFSNGLIDELTKIRELSNDTLKTEANIVAGSALSFIGLPGLIISALYGSLEGIALSGLISAGGSINAIKNYFTLKKRKKEAKDQEIIENPRNIYYGLPKALNNLRTI